MKQKEKNVIYLRHALLFMLTIFVVTGVTTACAKQPIENESADASAESSNRAVNAEMNHTDKAEPQNEAGTQSESESSSLVIDNRIFISVEEVMPLCGYEFKERREKYVTYYNNGLNADISFNMETLQVNKSDFVFSMENSYTERNDKLYVELKLLSGIVNKNITVAGGLSLRDVATVPHEWIAFSNGLIAHAGGGIDGLTYTSSYEAIVENYNKGHRVFELDLNMTSDGHLVGVHDWSGNNNVPMSLEEFKEKKIKDRFTAIDFDDITRIMAINKDMYIVTDTKSFEYPAEEMAAQFKELYDTVMRRDPEILKRIAVQIYNQDMYDVVKPYGFDNIIYTLYASSDNEEQVLDFVKRKNIKVVTMPPARLNEAYTQRLSEAGAVVYIHTINDPEEVKEYKNIGVWGFYTDFILPSDLS